MIDVTQELPKNKYGAGVTVVKIAASDKPGQDLRSHFPVRNITSVATKVDFCPLAGAKPLAYQNSKPLAKGKPLVSRPDLWLAGRTFGWPAGPLVGNRMT